MPTHGSDPLALALNDAASRKMSFGRDIIFTGGPRQGSSPWPSSWYLRCRHYTDERRGDGSLAWPSTGLWIGTRGSVGAAAIGLAGMYDERGSCWLFPDRTLLAVVRSAVDRGKPVQLLLAACLVAVRRAPACVAAKGSMFVTAGASVASAVLVFVLHRRWTAASVAAVLPGVIFVAVWLASVGR